MASLNISEESGDKTAAFSKPGHRNALGGRYQRREIYDNSRQESEDLWEYSAYMGENHSNSRVKGSIAQLTAVPYQVASQNLPNQTFRDGYIPHSYEGVTSYFENHEPDTQPMRPDISPLEFAGMVHVGDNNMNRDQKDDPDNIMVLRQKMRTGYALPPKPAVKFVDEKSTRSFIDTLKNARLRAGQNRGITLTAQEEYQQTMKEATQATRTGRIMKGVNAAALAKQFAGVFSSSSFFSSAAKLTFDALNVNSDLYRLIQNLRANGYSIPNNVLNEAFDILRSREKKP